MKKLLPTYVFLFVLISFNTINANEEPKLDFKPQNQTLKILDSTQRLAPITYIFDDGWTPSSPIGGNNLIDTIIIESGTVHISANTVCDALVVNPGAALIIDEGKTLTSPLVNLFSTSNSYSSLISNGTIVGTVNYHRYTSQIGTNDLISAPLSNQLFEPFAVLNIGKLAASGFIRAFAPYNTNSGAYENYNIITNALTEIESGVGYRAATISGSSLTFSGTVETNDVLDVPITDAAAGYGWNLIGNPYPSYLNFETFFNENKSQLDSGSYQAIYGYDGDASNGWTVWNQAVIDSPSKIELISPGQGFFVKSKSGGGSIDFTTSMRCIGDSDDFILGRTNTTSPHFGHVKIALDSNDSTSSTDIYFNSNATTGFDSGYDSGMYNQNPPDFSICSYLVDESDDMLFGIQTLDPDSMYDVEIPLGISANQGQEIIISILESDMPETIDIYLDDIVNNTSTLLTESDHIFTPATDLSGMGRFFLRFSSEALNIKSSSLESLSIFCDDTNDELVINGQVENDTELKIFDVNGRKVFNGNLNSDTDRNLFDVSQFTPGIYIIELNNSQHQRTAKKLIIR